MPNYDAQAYAIADAYQPPSTGRHSAIGDPETVTEFLNAVAAGNYLETACELAGISLETLRQWRLKAEQGEEPHKSFMGLVKKAERRAEALAVAKVRKAGEDPRFWAAEMTFLERRHPDRWARRSDSSETPKVVVQIGVKDSDVQVQIQSYAAESRSLSPGVSISQSDSMQALAVTDRPD